MTTVGQAAQLLEAAGVPSAAHDARVLASHAERTEASYDDLVAARARRVPLQHLVGSTGFRYLDIAVGPGVFVPRPETELLVDAVIGAITDVARPVVVDLCAGSGAIGLSVRQECPQTTVHLVERSPVAYEWLRRNAQRISAKCITDGGPEPVLHCADLDDAPTGFDGAVDVVVCNPPYVPEYERDLVDPEVRDHDPAEALWAGGDGLDVIRRVAARARVLLRTGGQLVMEHSDRHQPQVMELLQATGFTAVIGHRDLTGRPRYVTAAVSAGTS
jgi:release factor glutamine methyltransferase